MPWANTLTRFALTSYDHLMLHQCTEPRADFRELIYRGTSRDCHTADASGPAYLRHLYRILIPPDVAELDQSRVLLIAPHGLLHALPFHALLGPDGPLVERAAISYVPSLAAFQALLQDKRSTRHDRPRVLACGLSDYDSRSEHDSTPAASCQTRGGCAARHLG